MRYTLHRFTNITIRRWAHSPRRTKKTERTIQKMKNMAIIVKSKKEMEEIKKVVVLNGYDLTHAEYPAIATLQHSYNGILLMGLHPEQERTFLEKAGYLILSIEHNDKKNGKKEK